MQELSTPPTSAKSKKQLSLTPKGLIDHAQSADTPPEGLAPSIESIWWDAHGDSARALQIVENESGLNSVWVRAYLRRKMGDEAIAAYWYAKAIRPKASGSHVVERDLILKVLLGVSK